MKVQGKVAFVTGTNRGIGKSFVAGLLARGVTKVYAASRGGEGHADARVVGVKLDITNGDQLREAAQFATDVNLLINNAGVNTAGSQLTSDASALAYDMNVNYHGVVNVMRAFAPILEANAESAMLNVLSAVALAPMAIMGGYSASKAAQWSAVQVFRNKLRDKNVRVHAVFPGPIDTDMCAGYQGPMMKPDDLVRNVLDALEAGTEDIGGDGMGSEVLAMYGKDPASVRAMFATFG